MTLSGTITPGEFALSVDDERPFPYQLDGDYLGETTQLRFTHVPEAVRLVMPA